MSAKYLQNDVSTANVNFILAFPDVCDFKNNLGFTVAIWKKWSSPEALYYIASMQ